MDSLSVTPTPSPSPQGGGESEPSFGGNAIAPRLAIESPCPLWGGARGGGRNKGLAALLSATSLATLFTLLPQPAFAAAGIGGDVSPFFYQLAVFVMAIFVGYYVVWSVTPALHTPLMSVTNAISSVIVVGALLAVGVSAVGADTTLSRVFGFLALVMAAVNIFGGFLVTQRMLAMYKKKEK